VEFTSNPVGDMTHPKAFAQRLRDVLNVEGVDA